VFDSKLPVFGAVLLVQAVGLIAAGLLLWHCQLEVLVGQAFVVLLMSVVFAVVFGVRDMTSFSGASVFAGVVIVLVILYFQASGISC